MELDFDDGTIEKLLFRQILFDKNYLNIVSSIYDKRWIKTENLGYIISVCLSYYGKYGEAPNVQVLKLLLKKSVEKGKLNCDLSELNSFIDSVVSNEIKMDQNVLNLNLSEYIRKRALWCSIMDNVDDIEKNSDEVIEKCLSRFDKVSKIALNSKDIGMDYFSEEGMKLHWEYISNPEAKISTGWSSFDYYTHGGFLKGGRSLYLIMAQAGLGKSLFLSNLAVNFLKQGKKVVVISLEMSQDVYAQRFDAHISGGDINALKDHAKTVQERIKLFYEEHPDASLFIKEYPPRSIRVSDIEIYLENLKARDIKPDVIIVDYLNLILPQHSSDNMYQGALEVSEKLRALSYKYECPVVSAVQSNTQGMNTENIGMENISESRGIAHTADFIVAAYQMPDDRENGIINVRILKNRLGGQVGKLCSFKMDDKSLVLSDISFDSNIPDNSPSDNEADNILKNIPSISDDIGEDFGDI